MRWTLGFLAAILLTGLACNGKARRILRQPDRQIYELPPADAAWTLQPVEYQKSEGLTAPAKGKDATPQTPNMRGAGGGSGLPTGPGPQGYR